MNLEEYFNASTRTLNVIKRNQIKTVAQLRAAYEDGSLAKMRQCGAKTIAEVKEFLDSYAAEESIETSTMNIEKATVIKRNERKIVLVVSSNKPILLIDGKTAIDLSKATRIITLNGYELNYQKWKVSVCFDRISVTENGTPVPNIISNL